MGFYDESRDQIIGMLNAFNFAPAFPSGYTGTKAVVITEGWPYDLIDNMYSESGGKMTLPVLSVLSAGSQDTFRSLGGVFGVGSTPSTALYATRVEGSWVVTCWADQQVGGMDMVEKLAGLVQGCAFINREALSAVHNLRTSASHASYSVGPQLWAFDITLEGDALVSYYA